MSTVPPAGDPPKLPWLAWEPGQRVVVRYKDEDGSTRDALGTLLETAHDHVIIEAKRGRVYVHASQMIVGRLVRPPRRASFGQSSGPAPSGRAPLSGS